MRNRRWLALVALAPLVLVRVGMADEHHGDGGHGHAGHERHENHEHHGGRGHEEHERHEHEGWRYPFYPGYGVNPYFVDPYGSAQPYGYPYDPPPDDGFDDDGPYVEPGYGY